MGSHWPEAARSHPSPLVQGLAVSRLASSCRDRQGFLAVFCLSLPWGCAARECRTHFSPTSGCAEKTLTISTGATTALTSSAAVNQFLGFAKHHPLRNRRVVDDTTDETTASTRRMALMISEPSFPFLRSMKQYRFCNWCFYRFTRLLYIQLR